MPLLSVLLCAKTIMGIWLIQYYCTLVYVVSSYHRAYFLYSTGTPRSCSKLAKGEKGEAAIRKYLPTEETVDLRRKSSNRQLQHLSSPTATEAGQTPSLFTNAHLPSSSRQFTLDHSSI
ncbi:unnamed protein product, partial [Rodentolepis nana]|uniref:Secreted protein n=1 Tax=Rodentolepis nana TaxID=102285 RepID=A0A0R3U043_RODNA